MEFTDPIEKIDRNAEDIPEPPSEIQQYFSDSTVFITGATGFLGKLLVEKLLRTCPNLKRIYILMRPKKDKSSQKRFEEYFNNVIFDRLRKERPKSLEKVFTVSGDCGLVDLDLSENDVKVLTQEVNCVFHIAATMRFDEKIRKAAHVNVRGTRDLIKLAKQMTHLTSMVYVSTSFSFCTRLKIEEVFYQPLLSADQLLDLVEIFDEDKLDAMTSTMIANWPNTYVFTKSVAEDVVRKKGADLPIAVVRPSIILSTAQEPIPGWIDNFYGATGVIAGAGLGLIRTLHCEPNNLADMVPADYVINSFIAAAWDIATTRKSISNNQKLVETKITPEDSNIPIYNYVSSTQQPLTWKQCVDKGFEHGADVLSVLQVWHHCLLLVPNKYTYLFLHYLIHMFPAYMVDCLGFFIGKKPWLVKEYTKIAKFLDVIAFFSTQEWSFANDNTQKLWKKLNSQDRKTFFFNLADFDWDCYFHSYIPGIRVHLVKDPLETVPKGVARAFKLKIAHYTLLGLLALLSLKLAMFLGSFVF